MAKNRKAASEKMPEQFKKVNDALCKILKMLCPDFDDQKVWGEAAEEDILKYMEGLKMGGAVGTAISQVMGFLPDAVKEPVSGVVKTLDTEIGKFVEKAKGVAAKGTQYIPTIKKIIGSKEKNPDNYAVLHSLKDVMASLNVDTDIIDKAMKPLDMAYDLLEMTDVVLDFADFAVGTGKFVVRSLDPNAKKAS